jgi:hypothetical protein
MCHRGNSRRAVYQVTARDTFTPESDYGTAVVFREGCLDRNLHHPSFLKSAIDLLRRSKTRLPTHKNALQHHQDQPPQEPVMETPTIAVKSSNRQALISRYSAARNSASIDLLFGDNLILSDYARSAC